MRNYRVTSLRTNTLPAYQMETFRYVRLIISILLYVVGDLRMLCTGARRELSDIRRFEDRDRCNFSYTGGLHESTSNFN